MQDTITRELIKRLEPRAKPYEVRDARLKGFLIRVQPSGAMSYVVEYARGKRITLGKVGVLTLKRANTKALAALAAAGDGQDPRAAIKKDDSAPEIPTLREYIEDQYGDWVKAHRKTGKALVARISACFFPDFGDKPLDQVNTWVAEKWRATRIREGASPATVNRDMSCLKAALERATEWEVITTNPLAKVKPLREDKGATVRYLEPEEETRLRASMEARERHLRQDRDNGNRWRQARGYAPLPRLDGAFADHLKPMVLLSINTGLRRGELFGLKWGDINLGRRNLTIHGYGAKSGKTRHIPLNTEAVEVLKSWKEQQREDATGFVFESRDGDRFNNAKKSWAAVLKDARITNFRWHDMRHHFASKLVMAGVDLNTVRELLGHSDIKMTLRYAHLAPEHKAAAVEKLVEAK